MNEKTDSRSRVDRDAYRDLHKAVLERDGWRCQVCGTRCRLEVHHIQLRSRGGRDCEDNLITLCSDCHARVHGRQ